MWCAAKSRASVPSKTGWRPRSVRWLVVLSVAASGASRAKGDIVPSARAGWAAYRRRGVSGCGERGGVSPDEVPRRGRRLPLAARRGGASDTGVLTGLPTIDGRNPRQAWYLVPHRPVNDRAPALATRTLPACSIERLGATAARFASHRATWGERLAGSRLSIRGAAQAPSRYRRTAARCTPYTCQMGRCT